MMLEGIGYNILETSDKEVGIKLDRKEEKENQQLSNFIIKAVLTYIKEQKGIIWKKP